MSWLLLRLVISMHGLNMKFLLHDSWEIEKSLPKTRFCIPAARFVAASAGVIDSWFRRYSLDVSISREVAVCMQRSYRAATKTISILRSSPLPSRRTLTDLPLAYSSVFARMLVLVITSYLLEGQALWAGGRYNNRNSVGKLESRYFHHPLRFILWS